MTHLPFPEPVASAAPALRTVAVLLAPPVGRGLWELAHTSSPAALPFAHGLRVVDFQMANLARAGLDEVIVLQAPGADAELAVYLRQVWRSRFQRLSVATGDPALGQGGLDPRLLRRGLALLARARADRLMVLSADHICEPDLAGLLAHHTQSGALITMERHGAEGPAEAPGPGLRAGGQSGVTVFDGPWLLARLLAGPVDQGALWAEAAGAGRLHLWRDSRARPYWRRLDCLDTFRVTWLDFISGDRLPCHLPLCRDRDTGAEEPHPNLRESVVMAGASVAAGARVSRTIVAPGAHVPDGMVIGEDARLDARLFHRTLSGTVLVTAPMLVGLA
jgi:glucose-1-phosphate adenylyltransferase